MQQIKPVKKEQIFLPLGSVIRNINGDRYVVEGLLGTGGSGAVYMVRDRRNRDNVFAVKELIDPDKTERERFAFEAEVLMRLDHTALPNVYRVFENEKLKRVYILMDYIEGRDLEVLRKEQPDARFPLHLVLALLTPIVSAITYLHHREPPIVHRDIKPANIVVPIKGGDAMLVDFGIAKEYTDDGTTTVIRHGSPGYAALEQYGGGTNTRTDVYGLGATLYTLLTGTIPPVAVERVKGIGGIDPLKPAHERVPDLPKGVSDTITRALSISRDDRFATVNEFWEELRSQADGDEKITEKVTAKPARRVPRIKKEVRTTTLLEQRQQVRKKRRRLIAVAFIGVLLALSLGTVGAATYIARLPQQHVRTVQRAVARSIATPTVDQSPYPTLAASYKGTTADAINNTTTYTTITQLQQKQGTIHGFCTSLGLAGPFDGTVDTGGKVVFTVKIPNGDTGILFEGNIKTGGAMVGEFHIINLSSGQHTGEYGSWSVVQAP